MAQGATGLDPRLARYVEGLVVEPLPIFGELATFIADELDEAVQISPAQGAFLAWLVRALDVASIVEVGTFVGYSALWLRWAMGARGDLVTIERDASRAAIAERWHERAGLPGTASFLVGEAADVLADLPSGAFDLAFIDADKSPSLAHLEAVRRLVRPGGAIVLDNALHHGRVVDEVRRPTTQGIVDYNRRAVEDPGLDSFLLPLGDGLMVSRVRAEGA